MAVWNCFSRSLLVFRTDKANGWGMGYDLHWEYKYTLVSHSGSFIGSPITCYSIKRPKSNFNVFPTAKYIYIVDIWLILKINCIMSNFLKHNLENNVIGGKKRNTLLNLMFCWYLQNEHDATSQTVPLLKFFMLIKNVDVTLQIHTN